VDQRQPDARERYQKDEEKAEQCGDFRERGRRSH
jgi:hypothetical protein